MSEPLDTVQFPQVREATEFPTTAYLFDGKGGVEEVALDTPPPPGKGFLLVSGSLASPEFKVWLGTQLDPYVKERFLGQDRGARCTVIDDSALLVMRIVRAGAEPDEPRRQAMSLWLSRSRVIIAARLPIPQFVGLPQWQRARHAPLSPADLVARLGARAADRIEPLVERLGDTLDGIEEGMMSETVAENRSELARLRRSLISLRRLLWPQRDILTTLEIEDLSFLTGRDRARLREAAARSARLADELQVLAERAALIHEQVLDTRAERMNRTILVLTSVTVIAMPMTVVSGLLGMNVAGIPFAQNADAFWFVVLGLATLGTGMVWFMRKRKWL